MAFRHEILHIRRQQQRLIDIPGAKILAHGPRLNQTRSELKSHYPDRLLVLLCHKFLCGMFLCTGVAQHGHLDNLLARATLRRMRSVAIEFGTCRWVRSGGASGSVTVGNRKFLERPGGTRSTGGNRLPLGDQESVGGDAQRGVVVEAAPSSALEMPKPNLLLEFLIVALDPPAQLGEVISFGSGVRFRRSSDKRTNRPQRSRCR